MLEKSGEFNELFNEPIEGGGESEVIIEEAIQNFIRFIPIKDRAVAIEGARAQMETFVEKAWQREKERLPSELSERNEFTGSLDGWQKYLIFGFAQDNKYHKKYGFEDWSNKYLAQMLNIYEEDDTYNREGRMKLTKLQGKSFYEYYFGGGGIDPELWWGRKATIDKSSLLVHSLSSQSLYKVINSGVLGRGGSAQTAMSQDRIVYDNGYVILFQANELLEVGYPLLKIKEDPRDAEILREWRSAVPIDIHLARIIISTEELPGREDASKSQIATSYFGEDYLKRIERL